MAASIEKLVAPHEVAAVVAFLVSPLSVAINGDPINTGGGLRVRSTTRSCPSC
ncbi:hypothetical protein ABZS88_36985 [Streptomyces sp. NPDC005480]|uniref:hypothetical protein n=1 Tax=Streptomyces sp. NPDC005480 TaxID=3154880 RepID=UPI0033A1232D